MLCIICSFLYCFIKEIVFVERSIQIRIQQPEHSWSALFHIGTVLLLTRCYANGDSQTSPHFPKYTQLGDNRDSEFTVRWTQGNSSVWRWCTTFMWLYCISSKPWLSSRGSLEAVIRLKFRVFSITINTITSRNLSAIPTDQTVFTLQWLFHTINNTFIKQPRYYQPVNSFISTWWNVENNVCYRPGLKVV